MMARSVLPARAADVARPARSECPPKPVGSSPAAFAARCTMRATALSLSRRPTWPRRTSRKIAPFAMPQASSHVRSVRCGHVSGFRAARHSLGHPGAFLIGFRAPHVDLEPAVTGPFEIFDVERHELARRLFFANQGAFRSGDYEEIMNKVSARSACSRTRCSSGTPCASLRSSKGLRRRAGYQWRERIWRVSRRSCTRTSSRAERITSSARDSARRR